MAAGFLAVAWRPARAAGLAALATVVAAGLFVTAAADVASGVTSVLHEVGHLPELIGFALVAEGVHFQIPKGYLYFAMAFAVGVELINTRLRRAPR